MINPLLAGSEIPYPFTLKKKKKNEKKEKPHTVSFAFEKKPSREIVVEKDYGYKKFTLPFYVLNTFHSCSVRPCYIFYQNASCINTISESQTQSSLKPVMNHLSKMF